MDFGTLSKRLKEEDSSQEIFMQNRKMVHKNHKYAIILDNENLKLQLTRRLDAIVMKFATDWYLNSELRSSGSLKALAKTIQSLKIVRKGRIDCRI